MVYDLRYFCIKGLDYWVEEIINTRSDIYYYRYLTISIINNHPKLVKLFMKDERLDPTIKNNSLLRFAISHDKREIVNILIEDDRIIESLTDSQMEVLEIYLNKKPITGFMK